MEQSQFNRMLDKRLRDLADQRVPGSASELKDWSKDAIIRLMRACSLYPLPPRTDPNVAITGTIERDGYRIEKLRFESRPGTMVTGHLYLPANEGKSPLVISAMTEPAFGKTESWVQAKAIGLVLYGFAVLLVDPPGKWFESSFDGERASMGDAMDPLLCMGSPAMGVYAWDLIRALDVADRRPEMDSTQVAIEGFGYSGVAAALAFALDFRFKACLPIAAAGSLEEMELTPQMLLNVPHLNAVGDIAHLLAVRAPAPVFLGGVTHDPISTPSALRKTYDKLQRLYKSHNKESALRLEVIDAPVDYSRRVRESVYAFLLEHLKGEARRTYAPELRPMTDGISNPHEAGTEPTHAADLWVTPDWQRNTRTFRELLDHALSEPYPEEYNVEERLAPWAKYGRWEVKVNGAVLRIHDPGEPGSQDSIQLPLLEVEPAKCLAQGLSVAEFFGQLLHLSVPGGPEGWEARAHGADALSAMVASVKTLVGGGSETQPITSIEALGPVSSQAARFFKLIRPAVELRVSHELSGWKDVQKSANPCLIQPGARYMKWPF
ncbi:MAG: hypothetical protein KF784_11220 [Fimbriimonadaceae bacterium]|nr:hypothetical protein [Fimbriimonadaceae bacterium]